MDKVILITGASSGIGEGIARELGKAGARVLLGARRLDRIEAIAAEIHNRSKRRDMPFVAMDCGAISKELAGSELFGHEKGSFTGALNTKIGHFEMANGGTLFLDEVSNLSYAS